MIVNVLMCSRVIKFSVTVTMSAIGILVMKMPSLTILSTHLTALVMMVPMIMVWNLRTSASMVQLSVIRTQRIAIITDHMVAHVTTALLAMISSVLTSTSTKKVTTILIPMSLVRMLSDGLDLLIEIAMKVMGPHLLILMNMPTNSTTVIIIVIVTILLAHSLVTSNCHKQLSHVNCYNIKNGFKFECKSGFIDRIDCYNDGERMLGNHDSDKNAQCIDAEETHGLECLSGYIDDMLSNVRLVCRHVTSGLFVIVHLDHFIVLANLISRWMQI